MKTVVCHRRQVLRGAGGFSLALPFLPSLFPRRADGADVIPGQAKRLYVITSEHGAFPAANIYPSDTTLTTKQTLFPGHDISFGPLRGTMQGTDLAVTPALTAAASDFTAGLLSKMNVIRGFGMPFELGHDDGGHLGNFAANTKQRDDATALSSKPWPTIDQVAAWSPSFYGASLANVRERAIFIGNAGGKSWRYSNAAARSGTIEEVQRPVYGVLKLYDTLFGSAVPTTSGQPLRKPVVDKIIADYRSLRDGNRRLSPGDKQRLSDHLDRLSELERRLVVAATPVNCGKRPTTDTAVFAYEYDARLTDSRTKYQLANEVIALAFMCGVTRIAVVANGDTYLPDFNGDWHQDIGHGGRADALQVMTQSNQNKFRYLLLDMARRLDVPEAGGNTFLDNSLLYWSNEAGCESTHWQGSLPVVTFGSAGGFLKTGQYIDFRNVGGNKRDPYVNGVFVGLTYQRWLAIMLQAIGVPRAEFERNGKQGYGEPYVAANYASKFVPGVIETASEVPSPLKA